MKILVIPAWYSTPGNPTAGIFIKEQVQALAAQELQMAVAYADLAYQNLTFSKEFQFDRVDGLPTFRSTGFFPPKFNTHFLKKWAAQYIPLFEKYLEQFGAPDLLHAHSYLAAIAAQLLAEKYGIPYLVTEHLHQIAVGTFPASRLEIIRSAYNGANKIIAVSEYLKKGIEQLTDTEVVVIPNLVDTQKFCPKRLVEKNREAVQMISVGSLEPVKNYELLIRAFADYLAQGHKANLQIVGAGSEEKKLHRLVNALAVSQEVQLLGAQTQSQVIDLLQNAQLFISSSQVETFGVAMLEAMAIGIPVLATRSGGAEELIHEDCGLLVENGEPEAMTRGMIQMVNQLGQFSSEQIRKYVEDNYSKEVVAKRIKQLYEEIGA